jgi:aromatic ring-cleaving dioxygenase
MIMVKFAESMLLFASLLLLSALFLLVPTVDAHSHPNVNALTDFECGKFPAFESYHIHVLFWQNNAESTAAALKLRSDFMIEFGLNETSTCEMLPSDPAPTEKDICFFNTAYGPAGPFLTAQYSFFIPINYFQMATSWITPRRTILDIFVHPNSGCGLQDHIHYGMWIGSKWEIDPSTFVSSLP